MTRTEFLTLLDAMSAEELAIFQAKNEDYADRDGGNVLAQFDPLAGLLGVSPEMVLMIFLEKHLDATRAYCRHGTVASEPITGRIQDARVYLALLRAVVERRESDDRDR